MSVTLSEVTRAAKAHRAAMAGESAGYLVLAMADQVLSAPRRVDPGEIQLAEDGGVRVLAAYPSSEADAELGLRRALDSLLLVASSGSAALTRASRRTSPVGLPALVRELEAALIPVNRAAARRALARLHRETTRALASGALPAEAAAPDLEMIAAPVALASAALGPMPPAAAALVVPQPPSLPQSALAPAMPVPETALPPVHVAQRAVAAPAVPLVDDLPPETREVSNPPPLELQLLPQWDAMLTALCQESPVRSDASDEQSDEESDALTVALEVRAQVEPLEGEDVEFDEIQVESSEAPTVVRDAPVAPVLDAFEGELSLRNAEMDERFAEQPVEACTRPEPVVLRKAMRPVPAQLTELTELAPLVGETHALTPTLGSLVLHLPVLPPEKIAELCRQVESEPSAAPVAAEPAVEVPEEQEQVLGSSAIEASSELAEPTERAPEIAPLPPNVPIVASPKSDVGELLQRFQVADAASTSDLRRAIKELAELDLTPAPFAALLR